MPLKSIIAAGRVTLLLAALQCTGSFLGWAIWVLLGTVLPIPWWLDPAGFILGAVAAGFFASGGAARVGPMKAASRLGLSASSVLIALACFRLGPRPNVEGLPGDLVIHLVQRFVLWMIGTYLLVLSFRLTPAPRK